MERAIYITDLKNLKYFRKGRFQRIYWGPEFCQNLIPGIQDIEKVLRFAKENSLKITLVTPFVTQPGLKRLKEIFAWLKRKKVERIEIVVNDWGVLECLRKEFTGCFEIALGRLLSKQQRDPSIKRVLEKQPIFPVKGKDGKICIFAHKPPCKNYQEGIKASYLNSGLIQRFLSKFGAQRIELNNLIQGLNLKGIGFKKSLWTPFINISTTRFCPMETRFQKIYRINVCKKECQKYYYILRNRALPKIIYQRGNTTFYKNPVKEKQALKMGVDRIVYQLV